MIRDEIASTARLAYRGNELVIGPWDSADPKIQEKWRKVADRILALPVEGWWLPCTQDRKLSGEVRVATLQEVIEGRARRV